MTALLIVDLYQIILATANLFLLKETRSEDSSSETVVTEFFYIIV